MTTRTDIHDNPSPPEAWVRGKVFGRREKRDELYRYVKVKMAHYEEQSLKHKNADRILLAYDFDSRYVAMKHLLKYLDETEA